MTRGFGRALDCPASPDLLGKGCGQRPHRSEHGSQRKRLLGEGAVTAGGFVLNPAATVGGIIQSVKRRRLWERQPPEACTAERGGPGGPSDRRLNIGSSITSRGARVGHLKALNL